MAHQRLFLQTVIAVIWDFDQTLIRGYMQQPLLDEYKVDAEQFWREVNGLPKQYSERGISVSKDTAYLNHILTYVQYEIFKGLTNEKLKNLGSRLELYLGLPEFLGTLKKTVEDEFSQHGITLEHYIVSTGLKPIIVGSAVFPYVDGVWACEFIEDVIPPDSKSQMQLNIDNNKKIITQIGYMLDNTTKTRAIFEINKGTNKDSRIDVNASIALEQRRVPFQNMIYIADGPSDIPCFSILNQYHGNTFAVYDPKSEKSFEQVAELLNQGRVKSHGAADYTEGSQTFRWVTYTVRSIAKRISQDRADALKRIVQPPPSHLTSSPSNGASGNHIESFDQSIKIP